MKRFGESILALLAIVLLCVAAPLASGQTAVWSLTPSSWSSFTNATDKTAAELGVTLINGTSAIGAANRGSFYTWAAGDDPTGGQYAAYGASAGYIKLANNQTLQPCPEADGTIFGGTAGSYTGFAAVSFDVMIYCSDPASLTQTNDSTLFELMIGESQAFRVQAKLVNHTGVNYPQRKGWKLYSIPTASVVRVSGFANAATLEPDFEFNKVYTVTLYVSADAAAGTYGAFGDRVLHSRKTGHNTVTGLGNFGNRCYLISYIDTGYTSGPRLELRLPDRARIDNAAGWHSTALKNPAVAVNTGTTRVFHTNHTPLAAELEGYPLTVTKVTGTPTITATSYGTTAPNLGRSRFVQSGGASGDVVRISSIDTLAGLEATPEGDQYVGWTAEYIPTGSAVWGIRTGNDASAYALAVNFKDGLLREGSTAGSGTVLMAMDPARVYAVYLTGNLAFTAADGEAYAARATVVDQTSDGPRTGLVRTARLTTAWPAATMGVMSAVYTAGATPPEASTMHAGRRPGVFMGDSYVGTYAYQRGTVTIGVTGGSSGVLAVGQTITEPGTGATATLTTATLSSGVAFTSGTTTIAQVGSITGTLTGSAPFLGGGSITTAGAGTGGGTSGTATGVAVVYQNAIVTGRNNVGFHLANGSENHFLPNGWRPGKPTSTSLPDLVYAANAARSGRSIEQDRGTTEELRRVTPQGFGFCIPAPYAYNSMGSITAANWSAQLDLWATEMGARFNAVLDGRNTMIYYGGLMNEPPYGNFALPGAPAFMASSMKAAVGKINNPGNKVGQMWAYDFYPDRFACYVGAGDTIHQTGDTEGPRFSVSKANGNVSAGFATPALVKVAGKP
ncbi:MAG TPA: hypothetical protein VFF65_07650 [Phycisphaerales bacterium]|nr:hypothetical protein [Phycisphaerales bacterium]